MALVLRVCLSALVVMFASQPVYATRQIEDRIIVDGAKERVLRALPLNQKLAQDRDLMARLRERTQGSMCTGLYRGYRATWEIRDSKLFLVRVQIRKCGMGPAMPLSKLFPGHEGQVPATWFSGQLLVAPAISRTAKGEFDAILYAKYLYIDVENGAVISLREALPELELFVHDCHFIFCVGIGRGNRVFFPAGSSEPTPEAAEQLRRWVLFLKRFPQVTFELAGHADYLEDEPEDLSEQRVLRVKEYFVGHGIEKGRLSAKHFGATRPVTLSQNERASSQNRTVIVYPTPMPNTWP